MWDFHAALSWSFLAFRSNTKYVNLGHDNVNQIIEKFNQVNENVNRVDAEKVNQVNKNIPNY